MLYVGYTRVYVHWVHVLAQHTVVFALGAHAATVQAGPV